MKKIVFIFTKNFLSFLSVVRQSGNLKTVSGNTIYFEFLHLKNFLPSPYGFYKGGNFYGAPRSAYIPIGGNPV